MLQEHILVLMRNEMHVVNVLLQPIWKNSKRVKKNLRLIISLSVPPKKWKTLENTGKLLKTFNFCMLSCRCSWQTINFLSYSFLCAHIEHFVISNNFPLKFLPGIVILQLVKIDKDSRLKGPFNRRDLVYRFKGILNFLI